MNNDLISRSELKKAIADNGYSHYFEIFDIIDNAPTVERPKGEWIEKVETIQLGHGWLTSHKTVCSVCGGSGESDEGIPQCWKFCPHCGADMREEADDGIDQ